MKLHRKIALWVAGLKAEKKAKPAIGDGMDVYFKPKVFEGAYVPYYDAYKGHKFRVTGVHDGDHISLVCISDSSVIVQGAAHSDELKRA